MTTTGQSCPCSHPHGNRGGGWGSPHPHFTAQETKAKRVRKVPSSLQRTSWWRTQMCSFRNQALKSLLTRESKDHHCPPDKGFGVGNSWVPGHASLKSCMGESDSPKQPCPGCGPKGTMYVKCPVSPPIETGCGTATGGRLLEGRPHQAAFPEAWKLFTS